MDPWYSAKYAWIIPNALHAGHFSSAEAVHNENQLRKQRCLPVLRRSLYDSLVAMMLLSASGVDDSQRITILSSAGSHDTVYMDASTDENLEQVTYEAVASVIRQCDKSPNAEDAEQQPRTAIAASASVAPRHFPLHRRGGARGSSPQSANDGHSGRSNLPRMNPDEPCVYNLKSICNSFGMFGHWKFDHNADASIKYLLPSIETGRPAPGGGYH